jgi:hypothetical protein
MVTEASATEILATEALATEALATEASAAEILATEASATEILTTEALATEASATNALATEALAIEALATEALARKTLATKVLAIARYAGQRGTGQDTGAETSVQVQVEDLTVDDGRGVEEEAYVDVGGTRTDVSDLIRVLSALEERATAPSRVPRIIYVRLRQMHIDGK